MRSSARRHGLCVLWFGCLLGVGCQSAYAPGGGPGEPCLEAAECAAGLVCVAFTCAAPREEAAASSCRQGDRRCAGADVELPNLRARRVTVEPGVYLAGERIPASFLFENSGPLPVAAPATCDIVLSLDEVYSPDDVSIWSLDADLPAFGVGLGEGDAQLPRELATGRYHVLGICDPRGLVAEANEADNLGRSEGLIEILSDGAQVLPDLVPLRLTDADGGPIALIYGDEDHLTSLQVDILNQGARRVGDFGLEVFWSADAAWSPEDVHFLEQRLDSIEPGEALSVTLEFNVQPSMESGYLIAFVDFFDEYAEVDEDNNTLAVPAEVTLTPELERCAADRFEPNDTMESAARLEPGRYEGLLVCTAARDLYSLCPPEGVRAQVELSFDHDKGDIDIYLYDAMSLFVSSSLGVSNQESVTFVGTGECFTLSIQSFEGASGERLNSYELDYRVRLP